MPRPAPSCAQGRARTRTAPRCDPGRLVVARCAPRSRMPAGLDDVAAWAIGGQQHGMVVLDADGRVIRDALLWNDTRSAGAAADLIAEFGAEALAQRTGLVPVASFTITKLRWLRDHEPENAARVAAVALPHDWLTWRLRGFGPAGESPLGPVLDELVTDRSDASGTGYWDPATGGYDRDLLVAALGHDAILPRVLGPDEWVAGRGRPPRRRRGRRQRRRRARARSRARRRRGLDRHERHGLRGQRAAHDRPDRHGRRLRRLHRTLPAARRDPQRGARARRDRADCSASTTPSSAGSPSPPSPGAAGLALVPVLRGRAHAEPARCDGIAHRHDPRLDDPREPRAGRGRGHARRARRRPRGAARARRAARAGAADRRRRAVRGGARRSRRSCSGFRSRCPSPASTSRSAPRGRRHPSSPA